MKSLKRTKNNDLILNKNNLFGIQNIIFVCSVLMILFYFFAFAKFKQELYGETLKFKLSLYSLTFFNPDSLGYAGQFMGRIPDAVSAALRIFFIGFLVPALSVGLYLLNIKKFDKSKSYNIVMLQYALIVGFGLLNFILISMVFGVLTDNSMGMIRITITGHLYRLLNLVIVCLSFVGIIFTGDREVDETIITKDITSWEVMEEAKNSAIRMSKDVETIIKQETGSYCTACGSKNAKDANFCKECGAKIEKEEEMKLDEIKAQMKEKATEIKENIVAGAEKMGEKVDAFVQKAEVKASEIKESISEEAKEVSAEVKADLKDTVEQMGEKADEVVAKVEERASEIKAGIKEEAKEVSVEVKADVKDTVEKMGEKADEIVERAEEIVSEIKEDIKKDL